MGSESPFVPKVYSLHFCRSALGGLPQKSWFRRCIRPRSFYYLEKKETPRPSLIEERRNRRAPQAPSVHVRALAGLVADELRGRRLGGRLLCPAALIPVT